MRLPLDWNLALDSIDRGRDSIDRKWLQSCLVKMLMSTLFSQSMCTFSFCISPWVLTLNFISVFNIKNSYLWKNETISSFPIYQPYSQPIMNKVFYFNKLKKRNPWIFHKVVLDHLELPRPKTKTSRNSTLFFLGHPRNSTSLLINPLKFHTLFLWYPWKLHILNPPVWIFSGIIQYEKPFKSNSGSDSKTLARFRWRGTKTSTLIFEA